MSLTFMSGVAGQPMLVRVALANKMARTVWALMAHGEEYRGQVVTR